MVEPLPEPDILTAMALAQLGHHAATVLDVGARWGQQDWWRLPHIARLHGFEPDPEECAKLNAEARPGEHYHPFALGDREGEATLYVTRDPGSSSLYRPDPHFAATYPHLHIHAVQREAKVNLTRLDTWAAAHGVTESHVIKLDTQGAELAILDGAGVGGILSTTLGVECEVSFGRMYQGQPLLGDIQARLEREGLYLWELRKLCHYARSGGVKKGRVQLVYAPEHIPVDVGFGRLLWADAMFLRPPEGIALPTDPATLRTTMIAAIVYMAAGQYDLASVMVTRLLRAPQDLIDDFAKNLLRGAARAVHQNLLPL